MQKLLVYQSMWAMERRGPDGKEWTLEEKLKMIKDAGFDGAGVRFFDFEQAKAHVDILKDYGLTWQAQCYPQTVDDLKPILDNVARLGAEHLNLQPDVRPYRIEECIPYIEGWRRLAAEAGVRMHIETHRDRMTTDLFFTLHLLDCFPDLKLTGDISHYLVGREFAGPPISDENHRLMHRILDNCWGFHGRVASREQVQVPISFPITSPGSTCSWAGGNTASAPGAAVRRRTRRSPSSARWALGPMPSSTATTRTCPTAGRKP